MQVWDLFGRIRLEGQNEVNSGLNSMSQGFTKLGSGITNIGTKLTGALTLPIAGVTALGIKYNATMQGLQTDFKVMLGSQEKAVQMTEKLVKMGAVTPFESQELADATKTLLSFGYTGENVLPIMSRIGDISLGNTEKFKSLTRTMGQINALGRLQGGDLNQLIGQGWNPLNEITKKTGETMEQVRDRMSKGKVTYKEVEDALTSATSKGGTFYQGMAEGGKTFDGQLSTLHDTFNMFVGDLTKPIFDMLMKALPPVIEFLESLSDKFKNLSGPVKMAILVIGGIIAAIGPVLIIIGTLVTGIGLFIGAVSTIITVVGAITTPMIAWAVGIGLAVAGLIALGVAVFGFLQQAGLITPIITFVKDIFIMLKDAVIDIAQNAFIMLGQAMNILRPIIKQLIEVIRPLVLDIMASAKPIIASIIPVLKEFANAIMKDVITGVKTLKTIWDAVFPTLKPIIEVVFSVIKMTITNTLEVIKGVLKTATAIMKGDWSGAWNAIKETFSKIWDNIKNIASSQVDNLKTIGKNIIDGLVSGIKAGVNLVKSAVSNVMNAIPDVAKKLLGIQSPSRIFMGIGKNIGLGLIGGLQDISPMIDKTMNGLSSNLSMGINTTPTNTIGGLANSSIINNYTIELQLNIDKLKDIFTLDEFTKMVNREAIARGGY